MGVREITNFHIKKVCCLLARLRRSNLFGEMYHKEIVVRVI